MKKIRIRGRYQNVNLWKKSRNPPGIVWDTLRMEEATLRMECSWSSTELIDKEVVRKSTVNKCKYWCEAIQIPYYHITILSTISEHSSEYWHQDIQTLIVLFDVQLRIARLSLLTLRLPMSRIAEGRVYEGIWICTPIIWRNTHWHIWLYRVSLEIMYQIIDFNFCELMVTMS
jgi:hypothetical protein